jgi:hypothetical protein
MEESETFLASPRVASFNPRILRKGCRTLVASLHKMKHRSAHLKKKASSGRFIPKTRADVNINANTFAGGDVDFEGRPCTAEVGDIERTTLERHESHLGARANMGERPHTCFLRHGRSRQAICQVFGGKLQRLASMSLAQRPFAFDHV